MRRARPGPGSFRPSARLNRRRPTTGRFDVNRDGRVNALDLAAVRQNLGRSLGSLTAPAAAAAFSASPILPPAPADLSGGDSTTPRPWDDPPADVLGRALA